MFLATIMGSSEIWQSLALIMAKMRWLNPLPPSPYGILPVLLSLHRSHHLGEGPILIKQK